MVTTEYEPEWLHTKEDLEYMFGIFIDTEDQLYSPRVKKEIYQKAVKDLTEDENPFSLEYFFEKELLHKEDIQKKDLPKMKKYALYILGNTRNVVRKNRIKELFILTGIITKAEAVEATSVR